MTQKELRIGRCTLMAGVFWLLGISLALHVSICGPNMAVGVWAIICAAAGATTTVRCLLIAQADMVHNAFRLGHDSAELGVVPLRQSSN